MLLRWLAAMVSLTHVGWAAVPLVGIMMTALMRIPLYGSTHLAYQVGCTGIATLGNVAGTYLISYVCGTVSLFVRYGDVFV